MVSIFFYYEGYVWSLTHTVVKMSKLNLFLYFIEVIIIS